MREETVAIGALPLDCGRTIPAVNQRVTLYGTPAPDGSNVVLIEHALTGSSRAADWWPAIAGPGGLFDSRGWCVIGINALGSCYGSTGPLDGSFPRLTVRDIVRAEQRALSQLGIEYLALTFGGSLGGMRALQWALSAPERVGGAIVAGAHDHHSAMGIALNTLQREALELDPVRGLRLARKLAMLSYKSDELLARRHDRRPDRLGRPLFDVEGYLEHQADVFERRMNAASYAALTHAMDSFDVRSAHSPGPGSTHTITLEPRAALTFVGITSDWLFRAADVRAAAEAFARAGFDSIYLELHSDHGHDAFLAEPQRLAGLVERRIAHRSTAGSIS